MPSDEAATRSTLADSPRTSSARPGKRVVRGDIGDDAAQCHDRAFELLQRGRVLIGAAGMVDAVGQVADGLLEARQAFGRLQAADGVAQFVERALHAGDGVGIDAGGAADVDALGEAAHFGLECVDGAARHGLRQARADLREILDAIRASAALEIRRRLAQRLDLGGEIARLGLEAGQIRRRRRAAR